MKLIAQALPPRVLGDDCTGVLIVLESTIGDIIYTCMCAGRVSGPFKSR